MSYLEVLLWTIFILQAANCQQSCVDKMKQAKLIPSCFDADTSGDLQVTYAGNYSVQCGDMILYWYTTSSPKVTYDVQGKCDNVSVILFDPDTALPKDDRYYLHWFCANIPASTMAQGYKEGDPGDVVAKYIPLFCPLGTHRYTACVYCQQRYVNTTFSSNPYEGRKGKIPRQMAEDYGLGNPIACVYFYPFASESKLLYSLFSWYQPFENKDKVQWY